MSPRIVFVGAVQVGKTSLINYCLDGKCINPGHDFGPSVTEYVTSFAHLVDTSSELEQASVTREEIMSADILVLVFDVAQHSSLLYLSDLADTFGTLLSSTPIFICGNKVETHILNYKQRELEMVRAKFVNCSIILMSTVTGTGCDIFLRCLGNDSRDFSSLGSHLSLPHDKSSSTSYSQESMSPLPLSVTSTPTAGLSPRHETVLKRSPPLSPHKPIPSSRTGSPQRRTRLFRSASAVDPDQLHSAARYDSFSVPVLNSSSSPSSSAAVFPHSEGEISPGRNYRKWEKCLLQ